MTDLESRYKQQTFPNGYSLVDGALKHVEYPEHFQLPPDVIKRHIGIGHFVELRIDSSRFSVHEDDAEFCNCPSCQGEMHKPILCHQQPASLVDIPPQSIPSRGWGEDFWVRVTHREHRQFAGQVDNKLCESRLHGLELGMEILFEERHVLALHPSQRRDIVASMTVDEVRQLLSWLSDQ